MCGIGDKRTQYIDERTHKVVPGIIDASDRSKVLLSMNAEDYEDASTWLLPTMTAQEQAMSAPFVTLLQ